MRFIARPQPHGQALTIRLADGEIGDDGVGVETVRSIAFIASYPRSGNTFLRALLANHDRDLPRPLTTQEIAGYEFGEHNEDLLARCSGLKGGDRAIEDAWMARAAYFAAIRDMPSEGTAGEGPALVKTHTLNGTVFGLPAFDFRGGDRIVYIVRHPLDVAVSGVHFFGLDHTHMAARMLLPGATNHSGGMFWEITGSWVENVAGWLNEARIPILLVRYEALCRDPGAELARVLAFLDRSIDHGRIRRAVEHAAFHTLQASQQAEGFDQGPGRDARATFFRSGKVGEWRSKLEPDVAARLSGELGALMDVLGYDRAAGVRRTAR